MAAASGTTTASIKEQLLANGEKFSYFQAIRLLGLFGRDGALGEDTLRIRPRLSLGFPENDIDSIEPRPEGGYRVTANFFGLYGVASPLPTYYTEDLFEEERDGFHATRDFLDIVHHAMYPLLFDAWSKYRLQLRILEQGDTGTLNHLYAFVGLDDPELRVDLLPGSADLLRYAGLLNQRPRSVLGLNIMLSDAFSGAHVWIESCVLRALPIPSDQRAQLGLQGHCLGEDCYLGQQIDDYSNTLRIRFSDLPQELFHQLLPGASGFQRLKFLTRFYLIDPLHVEIELAMRPGQAESVRTNDKRWSRLGLDTWLEPPADVAAESVKFSL
jgi:type VI secretion system protein ImpH